MEIRTCVTTSPTTKPTMNPRIMPSLALILGLLLSASASRSTPGKGNGRALHNAWTTPPIRPPGPTRVSPPSPQTGRARARSGRAGSLRRFVAVPCRYGYANCRFLSSPFAHDALDTHPPAGVTRSVNGPQRLAVNQPRFCSSVRETSTPAPTSTAQRARLEPQPFAARSDNSDNFYRNCYGRRLKG